MSNKYPDLPYTNFPDSIDNFPMWLDIVAEDGKYIKGYQDAMLAGDINGANTILAQMPSATQKIIKATDLNTLTQAIQAMETFYKTDIEGYLTEVQKDWVEELNKFSYKSYWVNSLKYYKNNIVSEDDGIITFLYVALKDVPAGISLSNTEYWRQLTIQGEKGESGTGFSYRQEWNSSTTYDNGNLVTFDGILWQSSKSNNKNHTPSSTSTYWTKLITFKNTSYPIARTAPATQKNGEIWFNINAQPQNGLVTSFNGQTGDIRYNVVTSFNGATGAVKYTPQSAYNDNHECGTVKAVKIESQPSNSYNNKVAINNVGELFSKNIQVATGYITSSTFPLTVNFKPVAFIFEEFKWSSAGNYFANTKTVLYYSNNNYSNSFSQTVTGKSYEYNNDNSRPRAEISTRNYNLSVSKQGNSYNISVNFPDDGIGTYTIIGS